MHDERAIGLYDAGSFGSFPVFNIGISVILYNYFGTVDIAAELLNKAVMMSTVLGLRSLNI